MLTSIFLAYDFTVQRRMASAARYRSASERRARAAQVAALQLLRATLAGGLLSETAILDAGADALCSLFPELGLSHPFPSGLLLATTVPEAACGATGDDAPLTSSSSCAALFGAAAPSPGRATPAEALCDPPPSPLLAIAAMRVVCASDRLAACLGRLRPLAPGGSAFAACCAAPDAAAPLLDSASQPCGVAAFADWAEAADAAEGGAGFCGGDDASFASPQRAAHFNPLASPSKELKPPPPPPPSPPPQQPVLRSSSSSRRRGGLIPSLMLRSDDDEKSADAVDNDDSTRLTTPRADAFDSRRGALRTAAAAKAATTTAAAAAAITTPPPPSSRRAVTAALTAGAGVTVGFVCIHLGPSDASASPSPPPPPQRDSDACPSPGRFPFRFRRRSSSSGEAAPSSLPGGWAVLREACDLLGSAVFVSRAFAATAQAVDAGLAAGGVPDESGPAGLTSVLRQPSLRRGAFAAASSSAFAASASSASAPPAFASPPSAFAPRPAFAASSSSSSLRDGLLGLSRSLSSALSELDRVDAVIESRLALGFDLDSADMSHAECRAVLLHVFHAAGLLRAFRIPPAAMASFLEAVEAAYAQPNAFHTFRCERKLFEASLLSSNHLFPAFDWHAVCAPGTRSTWRTRAGSCCGGAPSCAPSRTRPPPSTPSPCSSRLFCTTRSTRGAPTRSKLARARRAACATTARVSPASLGIELCVLATDPCTCTDWVVFDVLQM